MLHLPSKFNALSLIGKKTMTNEDSEGLIPSLIDHMQNIKGDPERILILSDERGHLLERFKDEMLQIPR